MSSFRFAQKLQYGILCHVLVVFMLQAKSTGVKGVNKGFPSRRN